MDDQLRTPKRRARVGTAVVLALLVGACGSGDGDESASDATTTTAATELLPEPVQQIDIDGTEYTFDMSPDPAGGLLPGWTLVRFSNIGDEAHQAMFAGLKDGVEFDQLATAGAGDSSGSAVIEFVDMLGGVSYIDADQETTALVNLPAGVVPAMCYVPTADGVAHALLGMSTLLQVSDTTPAGDVATPGDAAAAPELDDPTVVGTIELAADGYKIPSDLPVGWYHVVNTDDADPALGLHEMSLVRLDESLDDDEVDDLVTELANNETPSVGLDAVGGLGALSPGFDGYLYLDLEPGQYVAVDFMPDPGEPRPHMLDGYYTSFTVDG
jgi:hypothetical protein